MYVSVLGEYGFQMVCRCVLRDESGMCVGVGVGVVKAGTSERSKHRPVL